MFQRMTIVAVVLAAGVMFAGCKSNGAPKATSDPEAVQAAVATDTLIPQAHPPVADLPVPIGFKIVESISRGYETGGARQIDHTYQGRSDKFSVERFYETQMPIEGWTMRGKQLDGGRHVLTFDKAGETAVVTVDTVVTMVGQRTNINVKVNEH